MKNILSLMFAGMTGGAVVLGGLWFSDWQKEIPVRKEEGKFVAEINPVPGNFLPENFVNAAELAMPAVVHISVRESASLMKERRQQYNRRDPFSFFFGEDFFGGPRGREGKGSGVIISPDGYIVTNNHVIESTDEFEVTLHDNRKFKAELIGADQRTDLAVLKIDTKGLPFLKFSNSEKVRVGEWVLAVGNPFDLTSTVTAGIVSAKGRSKILRTQDAIEDFIQTDAAVNPGNSGGALVDVEGNLIGINTAIATATGYYAGYSFAIPSNMVEPIVNNIIDYGGARVSLGVYVASISDYEEWSGEKMPVQSGLVVKELEEGGAAQYAGLLPGDIIVKLDDQKIENSETLVKLMSQYKVGDQIEVDIVRKGKSQKLSVRLKT